MKIEKVPKHVLSKLPKDFIEELYTYEKSYIRGELTYMQKIRLCEISSSLKAIELAEIYPQE